TRSYGDWSSDVCSSDLAFFRSGGAGRREAVRAEHALRLPSACHPAGRSMTRWPELLVAAMLPGGLLTAARSEASSPPASGPSAEIGRAACRVGGGRGGG